MKQYRKGQVLGTFEILRTMTDKNKGFKFYELECRKTGAKWLHIACDDRENTFMVAVKTLPEDSTGVGHILEHLSLAGSRKYPVRDPFFSMGQRSPSTFMNAFTSADWIAYPFATKVKKDFYNLLDIYLDAVFFPALTELNFRQEGWRYEFDKKTGKLKYSGVVYNEMKGAFSDLNGRLLRVLGSKLQPRGPYAHCSGGDPRHIPDLSLEQLKEYHAKYFHPSNAFFFTYGDLDLDEHLEFVGKNVIDDFERSEQKFIVEPEPRWTERKYCEFRFPCTSENTDGKYQSGAAWLLNECTDVFAVTAWSVLERILMGDTSAPLYKAISESGLGAGPHQYSGYDADSSLDTSLLLAIDGMNRRDSHKGFFFILKTLKSIAEAGIDRELIDNVFHKMDYDIKDLKRGTRPLGLGYMIDRLDPWMHGGDIFEACRPEKYFKKLKKALKKEPRFFENMIISGLLDNQHRIEFRNIPDPALADREKEEERSRLDAFAAKMDNPTEAYIRLTSQRLEKLQNAEEDPGCLPVLDLSDVRTGLKRPLFNSVGGVDRYPLSGNGITRLGYVFDVELPESGKALSLLPFSIYAWNKIGTHSLSPSEFSRLANSKLGDMSRGFFSCMNRDRSRVGRRLMCKMSCLDKNSADALDVMKKLYEDVHFDNTGLLHELLRNYARIMEGSIIQNGHSNALSLAARSLDSAGKLDAAWNPVMMSNFLKRFMADPDNINRLGALTDIRGRFKNPRPAIFGAPEAMEVLGEKILESIASFSHEPFILPENRSGGPKNWEAWVTSTQVSFVGMAMPTPTIFEPESAAALIVLSRLFKKLYLHREIREKGGAYGGGAVYDMLGGAFMFYSYRDDSPARSVRKIRESFSVVRSGDFSEQDVVNAVLTSLSIIDPHGTAPEMAQRDFRDRFTGITFDDSRALADCLTSINKQRVVDAVERFFTEEAADSLNLSIITSADNIKDINKDLGKELTVNEIL